ncbi:MAG: lipopolysaccharide heptosyltransferase I [Nitrospirae bacterium]|nr:lipopolysaccharide heptosyltransferase I [Nitrospirota bacterium]
MTAPPKRILFIKPSSLGDVIHALPVLSAIRRSWPQAEVDWVIARGLEQIISDTAGINRLVVMDKDRWKRDGIRALPSILSFRDEIRRGRYDLAIDLQGLFRSAMVAFWSGAPVRIGFKKAREGAPFFYNRKVGYGDAVHAVDRNMKIAEALGLETRPVEFNLGVNADAAERVKALLAVCGINGDYIVVNPGARWESKLWPAERFGMVAKQLASDTGLPVVVTGAASEAGIADAVCRASGGAATSLAGKTGLKELVAVLAGARIVITNDSGPMHIAAAAGTPVVAVFGPTDFTKTGPYGTMSAKTGPYGPMSAKTGPYGTVSANNSGPYGLGHVVVRANAKCAPCRRRSCADWRCMTGISARDVLAAATRILSGGGK